MQSVARGVRPSPLGRLKAALSLGEWRSVGTMAAVVVGLHGLCGPYTKKTTGRRRPPGLKRLGTNLAMLVKEGEGAWDQPWPHLDSLWRALVNIISGPHRPCMRAMVGTTLSDFAENGG